jgi:TM2 domain-containing membrane protein YozV
MPKSRAKSELKTKLEPTPPKAKARTRRKPKQEFQLLPIPRLSRKRKPKPRSWRVALLLSIFLGPFGADRFYLGRTRSAIIKLVTLSCFGVWWVTDFVLIASDWRLDAWHRPLKH